MERKSKKESVINLRIKKSEEAKKVNLIVFSFTSYVVSHRSFLFHDHQDMDMHIY